MDTTLKNKAEALLGEPLLDEPVRPESWECCDSDCGDACIQTIYWTDKAKYDAQRRKLKETGWSKNKVVTTAWKKPLYMMVVTMFMQQLTQH